MNDPKTINLDAIPVVNEAARASRAMGAVVGSSSQHKGANFRKPSAKMKQRKAQAAKKAREQRKAQAAKKAREQRKAQAAKKAREQRRMDGALNKPAPAVRAVPKLRVVNSSLSGGVVTYSDGSVFRFYQPVQERASFDYDDE